MLQARFGGRPHETVHLTCQRFSLQVQDHLSRLARRLEEKLITVGPFDVVAVSLVQIEHPFWQSRLLRWRIRGSGPLRHFEELLEGILLAEGVTPHFLSTLGWRPMYVTALEATPEVALERYLEDMSFPHRLFTGQQVVLSKIREGRAFDILQTIQL